MEAYEVNGRRIRIFGGKEADICIICGMENHEENEITDTAKRLYRRTAPDSCRLVVFETEDWNGDFSPWKAAPVFGSEPFAGRAPVTLAWILESLIPLLKADGVLRSGVGLYLAGYSLSGLFALWAFLECDLFAGAASCSGSLWFPNWQDYLSGRTLCREGAVYLSLGSREEKTKNRMMASVGDHTRETYRILKESDCGITATLEWNEGGHFFDPAGRLVKGMLWLILRAKDNAGKQSDQTAGRHDGDGV